MEAEIAAGKPLTLEAVEAANRAADTEGIAGNMYNSASRILAATWKYGPELKSILSQAGGLTGAAFAN
jgi:hypothetical protein